MLPAPKASSWYSLPTKICSDDKRQRNFKGFDFYAVFRGIGVRYDYSFRVTVVSVDAYGVFPLFFSLRNQPDIED
jgi:hypothetical protein